MPLPRTRIAQLTKAVATFYSRKCWWADKDDLVQAAELAAINAQRTFDPRVGVPEDAYLWRSMALALQRELWRDSSPVSGGMHRPREAYAGLHRASLDPPKTGTGSKLGRVKEYAFCSKAPSPEQHVSDAEWEARVRARLELLSTPDVVCALLTEEAPAATAVKTGLTPAEARSAVATLRARAARDTGLYDLMLERKR